MLILIRGISGSGKTTHAKSLIAKDPGLSHYEADMFFMQKGEYLFDPLKLKQAHAWCKTKTEEDLSRGKSVIVSNTFTQLWEIQPYLELAQKYNTKVVIKKAVGRYKNVHGVPEEVVEKMKSRWENIENEEELC